MITDTPRRLGLIGLIAVCLLLPLLASFLFGIGQKEREFPDFVLMSRCLARLQRLQQEPPSPQFLAERRALETCVMSCFRPMGPFVELATNQYGLLPATEPHLVFECSPQLFRGKWPFVFDNTTPFLPNEPWASVLKNLDHSHYPSDQEILSAKAQLKTIFHRGAAYVNLLAATGFFAGAILLIFCLRSAACDVRGINAGSVGQTTLYVLTLVGFGGETLGWWPFSSTWIYGVVLALIGSMMLLESRIERRRTLNEGTDQTHKTNGEATQAKDSTKGIAYG